MMDIEKEIQARVEFKMNELLTAVKNNAKLNWGIAFQSNSQKHSYYWEAFKKLEQMLIKEIHMPTPCADMVEERQREKRDKAVNDIMKRLCKRGQHDYHQEERMLVSIIKDAQNW